MNLKIIILVVVFCFAKSLLIGSQTLKIRIINIRNSNGQMCIAVFANDEEFNIEKPCWTTTCSKTQIVNNEMYIVIPVKPGRYAISVLDDENKNGKMDYKLIRLPLEGFGFSNFIQKGLKKPKFKDFSIDIGILENSCLIALKYF